MPHEGKNQTLFRRSVSDTFFYVYYEPITWLSLGMQSSTMEDCFASNSEFAMEIASSRSKW